MKLSKVLKTVSILLVAMLLISGCVQTETDESVGVEYPYTLTDDAGRTVVIPAEPQRIISFAPAHTETLFALGLEERLVGVDDWSNYPAETESIPKVGDSFTPGYEVIMELEPDLIFTVGSADSPLVTRLDELGIPVVVLQATSLDNILADMETMGRICAAEEQAEALINDLKERIGEVARRVEDIPEEERVTVFYEVSPPGVWGLWTIGPDSFIHDLIETAGGINVTADTPGDYFGYSEEMLLDKDPQVIITPNPETLEELSTGSREKWLGIAAVEAGRFYPVDTDHVSRPGPRIIFALEEIAKALYPDRF